jgi:uncharacterized Zn-binding protein involved in type VI secretion
MDSEVRETTFKCATLGCVPEYRNWAQLLGSEELHVTGTAVLPGRSSYEVAQLPTACAGTEASCPFASDSIIINTETWANIDDIPGATLHDIHAQIDKVKDLATGSTFKPRAQLQPDRPSPIAEVSVMDIQILLDAVKELPYPFDGPSPCGPEPPEE